MSLKMTNKTSNRILALVIALILAFSSISVSVYAVSESEKYLLVIHNQVIDVYQNDTKIAYINAPWHTADLQKLQYAQRFNKMFFDLSYLQYMCRILMKFVVLYIANRVYICLMMVFDVVLGG